MTEPTTTDPTEPTTTEPTTATPPETGDQGKVTFTPEQQAEIDRLMGKARKDGRTAAETALAQKLADEKAEQQRQKDIEAGEFEKVKSEIEQERDRYKAESDAHKERYDAAIAAIEPGVTKEWTDLPDEVRDLYTGAEDDVLGKAAHLQRTKPLVAKLTAAPTARVGVTPRPNGSPTANDDDAKRAQARTYKDF